MLVIRKILAKEKGNREADDARSGKRHVDSEISFMDEKISWKASDPFQIGEVAPRTEVESCAYDKDSYKKNESH